MARRKSKIKKGVGIQRVGKGWGILEKTLRLAPRNIIRAKRGIVRGQAEFFADRVREGITAQSPGGKTFKPLAPATIRARQLAGIPGRKALISLLKGFRVTRVGKGWFAGIRDKETAIIADKLENGYGPIAKKMTPAMRRYLMGVVFDGSSHKPGKKKGFVVITVPARPFIRPVVKKYFKTSVALPRIMPLYARYFKGRMGRG
jgi:hypothetical protein